MEGSGTWKFLLWAGKNLISNVPPLGPLSFVVDHESPSSYHTVETTEGRGGGPR